MTWHFVIDAQLPPALADRLVAVGFSAEHVNRIGLGAAADSRIWNYTASRHAILITKDGDFAERLRQTSGGPTSVIWIKIGNSTNRRLWAMVLRALPEILQALEAGEPMITVQ